MSSAAQKRARQQLSCTACRIGKLRCDRKHPCDQCIKRSRDSSCQYLAPPAKKKQNMNTKDRIAHLETLVVQLMNRDGVATDQTSPQSANENGSATSDEQYSSSNTLSNPGSSKDSPGIVSDGSSVDENANAFGQLTITKGEASYRGAAHWEAILEGIADVKDTIEEENDSDDEEEAGLPELDPTPLIILGTTTSVTKGHLLRSVPSKAKADEFLWNWFNSADPGLPCIHRPTFMEQYDRLFKDPSDTPVMWLALFYNIMALGCQVGIAYGTGDPTQIHTADQYHKLAAAALTLADYTKPKKFVVEALMTYTSTEYLSKENNGGMRMWLLTAIILRTALRMGYHRDANQFPNITVFEGEMRRRIWTLIHVFDVLQSYELGLPSMIQTVQSDTKRPSNLLDSDFGPSSTVLPPPRPLTEISPVSYIIVKSTIASLFAKACDISHMVQPPAYDDILALNRNIQQAYAETPPALQFISPEQTVMDPPSTIYHRFKLELLFQKTRCVLHRRHLSSEVISTPRELSRKLCVEAAMKLLKQHQSVYNASKDGGQLRSARAFMTALSAHDFLLAAMVVCMELELISKATSPATAGPNLANVDEMRRLINTTYNIYQQPDQYYANSKKVVKAMAVMLKKLEPPKASSIMMRLV
ncbi:hypothetical protein EJ08DRAFT_104938 [Tothia fuscella]|uniref:Zn(2)-C6 fungal-type domain-containing protein n=1 Tax=Tothia fuscella TaxID=1048955 RepID=A0A9P4NX70_9PEZI|nr:hypothetical protein EJ08DRAFT_104938 [Tothia fuscella]